jgi:2-oxoglutarate dehydrogenase complex dehydrogenase (E1) component-like enzyme
MLRSYRKPLIVVTPKIGLKHSAYVSPLSEFTNDNKFSPIITDSYNNNLNDLSNLKKVVFCSGQIYMELKKQTDSLIKENKKVDFITVRIEELAPFPDHSIMNLLSGKIGKETEFYWVQEESMNAGCFTYVAPFLRRIMRNLGLNRNEIRYIGRDAQVGANGCVDDHKMEVMKLNREISNLI